MWFIERPNPPILRDPMGGGGPMVELWKLAQRVILW